MYGSRTQTYVRNITLRTYNEFTHDSVTGNYQGVSGNTTKLYTRQNDVYIGGFVVSQIAKAVTVSQTQSSALCVIYILNIHILYIHHTQVC